MDFDHVFEQARGLPIMKEQLGVMSIDTLDRNWDLVKALPENKLLVKHKGEQKTYILGSMGVREDGKFCINVDVRYAYDHQGILENIDSFNLSAWDKSHAIAILNETIVGLDRL